MARKITITLTEAEVRALILAMSNMLEAATWREQLDFFGSAQSVKAAERALATLRDN